MKDINPVHAQDLLAMAPDQSPESIVDAKGAPGFREGYPVPCFFRDRHEHAGDIADDRGRRIKIALALASETNVVHNVRVIRDDPAKELPLGQRAQSVGIAREHTRLRVLFNVGANMPVCFRGEKGRINILEDRPPVIRQKAHGLVVRATEVFVRPAG